MSRIWLYIVLIGLLASCEKSNNEPLIQRDGAYKFPVVDAFPALIEPEDNPTTIKKVNLGRELFFDKQLSRDNSISCSSCHLPERSFSDGKKVAVGVDGRKGPRNSPALINMAWSPHFMWDGGPRSLEAQALLPFDNHDEFDFNIVLAAQRLDSSDSYKRKFREVFGEDPNAKNLTYALAAYQRTLISYNSVYDQGRLNESEVRGQQLFFSDRLSCNSCHTAPLFTNYTFENNGLFKEGAGDDQGRFRVTNHKPDEGKFKVPTLRNIHLTAPYMHDGRFSSLEEVIEHYNSGGNGYRTQSNMIKPLNLSDQEKADLAAFLRALTHEMEN